MRYRAVSRPEYLPEKVSSSRDFLDGKHETIPLDFQ
jgi:hypothetical protein